ncbi:PLD nuclease N-terminal domain-containing protein [Georgenia ruanii]|uniref:Cardiolipin synthase N-terminal domain-containing protein n=1 Tax=Georgenia ruanii TaxID=348442 RepID=A0A7J9UWE5_9MICO|nr:PLD nuclease N-terminal domain-containing protein [Georgenia ruanii]MPV88946.1 hypothetical protein [Georgenia ruanii]
MIGTSADGGRLLLGPAEEHDVLLPAAYDTVWSLTLVVAVVLAVVALVHLVRRKDLTSTQAALWALGVLLVPVAGPIVYLLIGRRGKVRAPTTG